MLELFTNPLFWFIAAIFLLIIESVLPGTFFAAIFAVAAVVTGILSLFVSNSLVLVLLFVILSLVGIFVAKPILEKHFKVNKDVRLSNTDVLKGKTGKVIKEIPEHEKGRVKVGHEDWSAKHVTGESIKEGETIIVRKIEGATLLVEKYVSEGGE